MTLAGVIPVDITVSGTQFFSVFSCELALMQMEGAISDAALREMRGEADENTLRGVMEKLFDAASHPPTAQLFTKGTLEKLPGELLISYDESEVTGMEGASTVIRIADDGTVSLNRFGTVGTNLVFRKHSRVQCVFNNLPPSGPAMSVFTGDMKILRGKKSGRVTIDYFVEAGGSVSEHDRFVFSWKANDGDSSGNNISIPLD